MALVDSHCHLPLIDGNTDDVLARAAAAGVEHMLCVCVDLESFDAVSALARAHDHVSGSVGVHPNTDQDTIEPTFDALVTRAADPAIVAIGETGLDYFRSEGDLAWQRERMAVHIAAARAAQKPLIIHCRDAAEDVIGLLRSERAADVGGVMHCFVDDWETARQAMDLGFYISFSGIVTFKNAGDLRDVAREVPAERLLVETDAPWLAPVPMRGKQNEPAFVSHTAACLAEIRNSTVADIEQVTTKNFYRLFSGAAAATTNLEG